LTYAIGIAVLPRLDPVGKLVELANCVVRVLCNQFIDVGSTVDLAIANRGTVVLPVRVLRPSACEIAVDVIAPFEGIVRGFGVDCDEEPVVRTRGVWRPAPESTEQFDECEFVVRHRLAVPDNGSLDDTVSESPVTSP